MDETRIKKILKQALIDAQRNKFVTPILCNLMHDLKKTKEFEEFINNAEEPESQKEDRFE